MYGAWTIRCVGSGLTEKSVSKMIAKLLHCPAGILPSNDNHTRAHIASNYDDWACGAGRDS